MLCQNLFQRLDLGDWLLHPARFNLHKYDDDSLRICVLEVDLEYLKGSQELHKDHPLAPDKLEIKRELLSDNHNYILL